MAEDLQDFDFSLPSNFKPPIQNKLPSNLENQLKVRAQISDSRNMDNQGSRFESADFIDYMPTQGPNGNASNSNLPNDS